MRIINKMNLIESTQNNKVQMWNKLKKKKERDRQAMYFIEGIKLVKEAIQYNQDIDIIIFNYKQELSESIVDLAREKKIDTVAVSNDIFIKLAETESPQGVLAVIKKKEGSLEQIINENNTFLLIDEVQDPGNLGAIIRSADSAGISSIIIGDNTVDLYNQKVIRSTMGSLFHLPIINYNITNVIKLLKQKNIKVLGTSPRAEQIYFETDISENIAILVGNEANGLSEDRLGQVDQMISIPIVGQAESLNVAMATSVILYEHVRQRYEIDKKINKQTCKKFIT